MTTPVSMPAGHAIVASDLDAYENLTAEWTTYAPTLTGSVTSPTNYTSSARYARIGSTIVMIFQIVADAAFTAGSGTYSISVPVTGVLNTFTSGAIRLFDNSTGNAYVGARVALSTTTTLGIQVTTTFGGTLINVSNTVPWTWAANDIMDGFIIYERA